MHIGFKDPEVLKKAQAKSLATRRANKLAREKPEYLIFQALESYLDQTELDALRLVNPTPTKLQGILLERIEARTRIKDKVLEVQSLEKARSNPLQTDEEQISINELKKENASLKAIIETLKDEEC